jgi:hypothetical protein
VAAVCHHDVCWLLFCFIQCNSYGFLYFRVRVCCGALRLLLATMICFGPFFVLLNTNDAGFFIFMYLCVAGFRVQGSGFSVQGSGFRVQGSGFRVQGSGFRVQGSGFRVQGSGLRAQASGFRLQASGFRLQASGFRLQGSGFRVQGSGLRV